jgi:murein DD-endopeptidase MepM/ murein hydrolase activator NlpD
MSLALVLLPVFLLAEPSPAIAVRVTPQQPSQGGLVVIELLHAAPGAQADGTFNGVPVRFFSDARGRTRALTAVALKQPAGTVPLQLTIKSPGAPPINLKQSIPITAGTFATQKITVNPKYVSPPKEMALRIKRENALLAKIYRAPPTERQWRGDFSLPSDAPVGSAFGLRRMFNGVFKSRHLGLDISGDLGDPVRAINDGTVVMAMELYYSGGTVIIDHGLRLYSLYLHLSAFDVAVGQKVVKGQVIARVGASGRVTGPHLHVSTRIEQVLFDPNTLLHFNFDEELPREAHPDSAAP